MSSRQASHLLNITKPSSVITWLHSSLLGIPNHRYFIGKVCKRVHDSLLEILNNFLEILKPSIFHWNNNKIASQQFLWYYKSYIMVAQQLFCVWRETLVRTLVWKMTELPEQPYVLGPLLRLLNLILRILGLLSIRILRVLRLLGLLPGIATKY